jgi:ABC-type amino acid transport system permease subunit
MNDLWVQLRALILGYPVPPEMIDPGYPQILQQTTGFVLTVLITVLSLIVGAVVAAGLVVLRQNPLVDHRRDIVERALGSLARNSSIAIIEVIRGLPIIVLVLLIFSLPYPLAGLRLPGFLLALVAFSLYAAVYFAESMRAGLRSIDPQLRDSARVLGLTRGQILWGIDLPLTLRAVRPDLINIAVTVFKDTSVLAVVALPELTYTSRQMQMSEPADYGVILLLVLVLYWAPAATLSGLAQRLRARRPPPYQRAPQIRQTKPKGEPHEEVAGSSTGGRRSGGRSVVGSGHSSGGSGGSGRGGSASG